MDMNSLLLTIHVITLSLSLLATVTMVIMALFSRATPFLARRTNLFVTGLGITLGVILLIQMPLGMRCLELTAYLVVFSLAYRFVSMRSTQLARKTAATI